MLFSRTYRYSSSKPIEDIKSRLCGQHIKVHDMDFEVSEKDSMLRVIPHAEQETSIRTLPITHVELRNIGAKTQIRISAKMRKIDSGGPLLIVIFCFFLLLASIFTVIFGGNEYRNYTYILLGISLFIFLIFWIRMESGYFDYVRKIRNFIKQQAAV